MRKYGMHFYRKGFTYRLEMPFQQEKDKENYEKRLKKWIFEKVLTHCNLLKVS